jgi:hypothetical protein
LKGKSRPVTIYLKPKISGKRKTTIISQITYTGI